MCSPVGRGRAALSLIETLGLQRETLCSSDAARKRYLIQRGTLVALPATMTGLMLSPLTRAIPLHALRELFDSPKDGSRVSYIHLAYNVRSSHTLCSRRILVFGSLSRSHVRFSIRRMNLSAALYPDTLGGTRLTF